MTIFDFSFIRRLITIATILLFSVNSANSETDQSTLAHKFVATGKEVKGLHGNVQQVLRDGRILLGGNVVLPATPKFLEGPFWLACANRDGHVLWSARAQEEPHAASLFPLSSDGEFIWIAGLRQDGVFRFGKFDARTLAKVSAVQLSFAPTKNASPCLQFHSDDPQSFDLQVSLVQPSNDSVRVALFTRDLQLRFDKLYKFDFVKNVKQAETLAMPYLIRLPDKSGYYLCLRRQVPVVNGGGGVCIIKIDNQGEVVWANTYALGSPEVELEPHETTDGSILVHVAETGGSVLVRVNVDGTVRWAISVPGIAVNFPDFNFGWQPYRFIRPHLFASGMQIVSNKVYSTVFAIDYDTGKIDKEVKCEPNASGGIGFTEFSGDSIYVTLLDQMMGRGGSRAALFAFDANLKLRAARTIRNAEPHWPILHALGDGKLLSSYSYAKQKAVVLETVDANLDSRNACGVLQNAAFIFTQTYHGSLAISITPARLSGITVSDAHDVPGETDFALVPFLLESANCPISSPP